MSHIIIDGYNLIRSSSKLSSKESLSLEQGRLALISQLSAYKKKKSHTITIVFDAADTNNISVNEDKMGGVKILYSKSGQSADEVIKDMARLQKDKVIIVSSDNNILHTAKLSGCGIISSEEFYKKVNESLYFDLSGDDFEIEKKPVHKRWITKKKGPSKRLPKAKRKARQKLDEL